MASATCAAPVAAAEFAELMQRFAPFESAPHLAVAVSGGGDSMALALLAQAWTRACGGAVTALTVDHRLRPESAAEAAQAGAWLAARGIDHRILPRTLDGSKAGRGVQAAARAARYALLEEWCGSAGVLHLLVAHHREDQAETTLLRLARGSGLAGLAAMSPVVERTHCRVLRPLLALPRARLLATLEAAGQAWIEDPSNDDPAYARVRLRRSLPALAEAGLTTARIAATASRLGEARGVLEDAAAALLADAAQLDPRGYAWLNAPRLTAAPAPAAVQALAALLGAIGGRPYGPRRERLERLYHELRQGLSGGRTLGGCCLLPRRRSVLVCREPAAMAPPVPAPPGATLRWDGRFRLRLVVNAAPGLRLGGLGAAVVPAAKLLPAAVRSSVPALSDDRSVVAIPALGYVRDEADRWWLGASSLDFRPTRPLTAASFTVV